MREVKEILDEAQEKMDMAVMYLEEALAHIRAGKADVLTAVIRFLRIVMFCSFA